MNEGHSINVYVDQNIGVHICLRTASRGAVGCIFLIVKDFMAGFWGMEIRIPLGRPTDQQPVNIPMMKRGIGAAIEVVDGKQHPEGITSVSRPSPAPAKIDALPLTDAPPPIFAAQAPVAHTPITWGISAAVALPFAHLFRVEPMTPVSNLLEGMGILMPTDALLTFDIASCGSLPEIFAGSAVLNDLWFVSDTGLRFHISRISEDDVPIETNSIAIQIDPIDGGVLIVLRQSLSAKRVNLADLRVANRYAPVLSATYLSIENFQKWELLPFYSFSHAGAHEAELALIGQGPGQVASLRVFSVSLSREALGWGRAPTEPDLGRIEVGASSATLAERLFSEGFQTWLAVSAGLRTVPIGIEGIEPVAMRDHLHHLQVTRQPTSLTVERIGRVGNHKERGIAVLHLQTDALPTQSAILLRRLNPIGKGLAMGGAYTVTDIATGKPGWVIAISLDVGSETFDPLRMAFICMLAWHEMARSVTIERRLT